MQSLAIVFGDNDFIHTFEPLIETLHRALQGNPDFTPEQIIQLIGEGIRFHYLAFQNQYSYEEQLDRIEKYLKGRLRILFDAEADLAFQTEDHDGSACTYTFPLARSIRFNGVTRAQVHPSHPSSPLHYGL